jgi:hypothetical protein
MNGRTENGIVVFRGEIANVSTKADRTLSLRLHTQELPKDVKAELMEDLLGVEVIITIMPSAIGQELPD